MEKFDSQFPVLTSAKGTCCLRSYAACVLEICFIFIYNPFSFVASSRSRFGITFYLFVCCFPPSWSLSVFDVCTRNVPEEKKPTGRRLRIIESGIIVPSTSGFIWISAMTWEELLLSSCRWLYCGVCYSLIILTHAKHRQKEKWLLRELIHAFYSHQHIG